MTQAPSQESSTDPEISEILEKMKTASRAEVNVLYKQLSDTLKEKEKDKQVAEKKEAEQKIVQIFEKEIFPQIRMSPQLPGSTARFLYVRKSQQAYEMIRLPADVESLESQITSLPLIHGPVMRMMDIFPSKKLTKNRLKETLSYILDSARMIPGIEFGVDAPYCSNSSSEPCQHYIPLEVEEGPTPCWDQFLARVDLQDEFLAFIWSVFCVQDRGRQLLWVRDAGGGGKTSVSKTLAAWLGNACGTFDAATLSNNHGAEGRIGKRLLVDSDSKMYGAVVHEEIHKITGGDNITINPKGKKMYTANAYSKVIIMSNYYPKISSSVKNERSRLLMVKLSPRTDDSSVGIDLPWEQGLIDEKKHLLFKAREAYARVSRSHEIDSSRMNWDEIESGDLESFYSCLEAHHLVFHPKISIKRKDLESLYINGLRPKPTGSTLQALLHKMDRHLLDKGMKIEKRNGNTGYWIGIGRESDVPKDEDILVVDHISEENI